MKQYTGKLKRLELYKQGLGKCSVCGEIKPLSMFGKNKNTSNGYHYVCKKCTNAKNIKTRTKTKKSFSNYWAKNTINSHKTNGYKINISEEFISNLIKQTDYCPICGCKLQKEYGAGHSLCNASLDDMDNSHEIREDNIQIICRRCNTTKLDRSMEEMYEYCKRFIEFYEISETK